MNNTFTKREEGKGRLNVTTNSSVRGEQTGAQVHHDPCNTHLKIGGHKEGGECLQA